MGRSYYHVELASEIALASLPLAAPWESSRAHEVVRPDVDEAPAVLAAHEQGRSVLEVAERPFFLFSPKEANGQPDDQRERIRVLAWDQRETSLSSTWAKGVDYPQLATLSAFGATEAEGISEHRLAGWNRVLATAVVAATGLSLSSQHQVGVGVSSLVGGIEGFVIFAGCSLGSGSVDEDPCRRRQKNKNRPVGIDLG